VTRDKAIDDRLKALDVLQADGRPRSKAEILCIERQRADLLTGHERGLVWDESEAVRNVRFAKLLKHWKKPFTGMPFVLEPWQEQLTIAPLFGWYREKTRADGGRRRFNTGYKEVPRKNGKTTESAVIAAQGLIGDMEDGAEVYATATMRDQAVILFNDVKNMVRQSPDLMKRVQIWAHAITCEQLNGSFKPLSADHNSLHGLNVSRAVIDELHSHKTRDLWDVISTATGTRLDPLVFAITTAGFNRSTICWEQHEYLTRIRSSGSLHTLNRKTIHSTR
jgi:phage terminase large subunit-like protein